MADLERKDKCYVILMVDDDQEDFHLVQEALELKHLKVDLYWAEDGYEAMNFLARRGVYKDAPTPDLILLDLNMPGKNGFEVLRDLKAHPKYRKIPVVILTSSRDQKSVSRGYNIGASSFMLKPMSFDELADAMEKADIPGTEHSDHQPHQGITQPVLAAREWKDGRLVLRKGEAPLHGSAQAGS